MCNGLIIETHFNEEILKDYIFIKDILKKYTKRAYIVGGACRDFYLNTKIKDIDIEVYDIDIDKFHQIMLLINANGIGKSFFVYKYNNHIDISLARKDNKISNKHNGFEVAYVNDEKEATQRRDFTINSIMINIFTNNVLDINNGLKCLENKQISIINKEKFAEDSLRVLRAVGFSSRLGFKINKKDLIVLNNMSLENLSHSRILEELEKMFKGNYLHFTFYYFIKLDLLQKVFHIQGKNSEFIKTYRILRNTKYIIDVNNKYFFLYILSTIYKVPLKKIFEKKILSKDYKNNLKWQIKKPNKINNSFLYALSLQMPIKNWLGLCDKDIVRQAKNLNVFDEKLNIKHITKEILNDGFKNKEFAKELKIKIAIFIKSMIK